MTDRQRVVELKNSLDNIQKKLFELSKEISIAKDTSNLYWAKQRNQAKKLYEEARLIFVNWSKINLPEKMNESLKQQIATIKQMSFQPSKSINYLEFKNKDITKQTTGAVISNANADYITGLNQGEKRLNRLMSLTQQLNITEDRLDKAISEGFQERKSIYGVRKKLQEELVKDAIDKKYITVIDKNGITRNYDIKKYSEMVARTELRQIQTDGTVNLALAYGSDLVQVSAHNTETPYDSQFEGRIYSLSGKDPDFPPAYDLPPFHPECIHVITVYFKDAHSEKEIKEMSDYSLGKTEQHPYRKNLLPNNDLIGRKELAIKSKER